MKVTIDDSSKKIHIQHDLNDVKEFYYDVHFQSFVIILNDERSYEYSIAQIQDDMRDEATSS